MEEKQTTEEKITETTSEKKTQNTLENLSHAVQHEDAAMKAMMQFFADELLEYFGIEGKAVSAAPTESIYLELKKLYEDFNLVMEDGTWKHFEFQSTNEGKEGLKRFRSYEAVASCQYGVEITTYVLFSGTIKNPMTEFTEGVNTYRIVPIIMQDRNAGVLIKELQEKAARGEKITKSDLVRLTLCPLMGGEMSQKDRILAAFEITKEASEVTPNEKQKIEAVIYTMADKFLDSVSMEEIKEAVSMTKLGQMLVEDGFQRGISEGISQGISQGFSQGISRGTEQTKEENARNLLDILNEETIAERIGLPLETVRKLKEENMNK